MSSLLLTTKVTRPRVAPQNVPRQRLIGRLDSAFGVSLTLLSAPAGFGKTTLVAEWLAHRSVWDHAEGTLAGSTMAGGEPVSVYAAWLALDDHDNNPVRFWSYLAASLAGQEIPGVDAELDALAATLSLPHPPTLDTLVDRLAATLSQAHGQVVIVLDDYHHIRS
ncbi:MAG: hypothetical protein ACRC1H_08385, partial [Caldilineaceae bacterium]